MSVTIRLHTVRFASLAAVMFLSWMGYPPAFDHRDELVSRMIFATSMLVMVVGGLKWQRYDKRAERTPMAAVSAWIGGFGLAVLLLFFVVLPIYEFLVLSRRLPPSVQ
jgi:hypothetical protein